MSERHEPGTDRHDRPRDRVTERLDELEVRAREQLALIEQLRADVDDGARGLAEVRTELRAVAAGQDAIASSVGELRAEQRGLLGELREMAARVPSGRVVGVAGLGVGAAGLGSIGTILYHAAQALGWIGAQ